MKAHKGQRGEHFPDFESVYGKISSRATEKFPGSPGVCTGQKPLYNLVLQRAVPINYTLKT